MIISFSNNKVPVPQFLDLCKPPQIERIGRYVTVEEKCSDAEKNSIIDELITALNPGDTIMTSTLLNLSSDYSEIVVFITRICEKKARIISTHEMFDSASEQGRNMQIDIQSLDSLRSVLPHSLFQGHGGTKCQKN